ncbi:MAG: metallophosphoesterase [bacterium]
MFSKNKKVLLILAMISFFAFVSVLLIELNMIVYSAFVDIFKVNNHRIILDTLLAFFSGGFMIMLLLERYYTNKAIRFFYLLTSIGMGFFVYFFIASILFISVNFFIKIQNTVGILFFIFAIVISIYGIIHGKKIIVKKIQVSIPNIPDVWKGRKAVWMSDLHLGPINGVRFAEKVTKISNSLSPDLVFIGGDLYDGSHKSDPYKIAKPLENLSSRLGVFFITGNHEEFGSPEIFLASAQKLGINILFNRVVNIEGVQIIGVDYLGSAGKKNFKNILNNLKINKDKPSILLKHEPKDLKVAEEAGISFQISGHTHNGQQWPFNYLTNLMYKGYGYGLKKYGSMIVYVSSGTGGWGPPLRVGSDYEIVEITFI